MLMTTRSEELALDVAGLRMRYGMTDVLHDVTVQVRQGEVLARLGRQLADDLDTTIVLATHDLDEAETIADRIIILTAGRIIANGTSDELSRQIAGEDEVRWTHDGQRCTHSTPDSTKFARELFA